MLRISELRKIKNVTQKELALKINVKNYTVANWEQERSSPSVQDLIALADYFECSVDYLIGREDDFGNVSVQGEMSEEEVRFLSIFKRLPKKKQSMALEIMLDMLEASRLKEVK